MVFVVTHWINLICMVWLIFSGFIIHYPFIPVIMGICRGSHVLFGCILLINMIFRVIAAFFVKTAPTGGTRKQRPDYLSWLPQKDNRHQALEWIKYYLFLKKDHPLGAKLGVPQKLSYLAIPVLILIMWWTGMCIWAPVMDLGPFAATVNFVGGAMSMRIIHYYLMFVFIIFMFIHIYLANVESIAPTKLMFIRKEHGGLVYDPELHNIVGEDMDPHKD